MKDCLLGLYEKSMPNALNLEQKLATAVEFGFDFLEISVDESEEKLARLRWSAAQRNALFHAVCRTGTPIKTMCLSAHRKYPIGSADEPTRRRGMQIMSEAIDLAADLGIRIIQLAGYDCYYEPSTAQTREFFIENLRACAELAARQGVVLAFETMETEFMNTVAKAMHYVGLID